MSIPNLTDANFQADNGGRILRLKQIPGFSFVMFKTDRCPHCTNFLPTFQSLARRDQRVRFFIANVDRYKNIVGMAQTTNTPIKGVPMFIFYVNGMPKAKYNGKHVEGNVLQFLSSMVDKFASSVVQNFVSPPPQQQYYPQQGYPQQQQFQQAPQRQQQQSYGPVPTQGMVNYNQAMQGQTLGIGMSQAELERRHRDAEVKNVPDGVIPHNAPWTQYRNVNFEYQQ